MQCGKANHCNTDVVRLNGRSSRPFGRELHLVHHLLVLLVIEASRGVVRDPASTTILEVQGERYA